MRFQLRSQQDMIDFTNGCCFYGTGGGGDPKFGQKMLQEIANQGKVIDIIDVAELADETMTVCPFLMGSSGPDNLLLQKELGLQQPVIKNMALEATYLLLEHAKQTVGAIIPIEIGGATTACAAAVAASLGVPLVDGDYAGGRAFPALSQMLPSIHGLSFCPLMSVDAFNNQIYVQKTANAQIEERLGKIIASASGSLSGQAGLLQPIHRVKSSIQPNTLSRSLLLGKALRKATEAGNPMIPSIVEHAQAEFLIKGRVIQSKACEKNGYYYGEQIIQENGNQVKIWFKNEYLQLWKNDELCIQSPHLICVVQYPSGQPLLNTQVKEGDSVAVFGLPAPNSLQQRKEWYDCQKELSFNVPQQS